MEGASSRKLDAIGLRLIERPIPTEMHRHGPAAEHRLSPDQPLGLRPLALSLGLQTLHDDELGSDETTDPMAEQFLLGYTDFLTPDSLLLGHTDGRPLQVLKARPAFFDASGLQVQQHWARSLDGTRVPYFLVARAGLVLDGSHPTLLNGYGGFEIA